VLGIGLMVGMILLSLFQGKLVTACSDSAWAVYRDGSAAHHVP